MSKIATLRGDIVATAGGQIGVMLGALLINKVVSSYLAPPDFAIFSIVSRTASIFAFIMLLGLGIAIPRYIAQAHAKKDISSERTFLSSACILLLLTVATMSLVVLLFSEIFSQIIFGDVEYTWLVGPMLFFAVGIALSTFVYSYYRGVGKFKEYNILQVLFQLINLLIVVAAGAHIAGQLMFRGAIISILSVVILLYVVYFVYAKIDTPIQKIKASTKELLSYCLPRVPGEAFLFSFTVVPIIIINSRFGLHDAAAFATAVTLIAIVAPFFQFIGTVLLPYVSKQIVNGEMLDVQSKVFKFRLLFLSVGVLASVAMLLLADFVIALLFTKEYVEFSQIVRIVFLSVIPYGLYLLLRNPLDAISKKPFNTLNLGISLGALLLAVAVAPNIYVCAAAFPASYLILGLLSEVSWYSQLSRALKHNSNQVRN